jgi:hypothetical protein
VDVAKCEEDIGQFGREFNGMIQRLDENRLEIEELHKREMTRNISQAWTNLRPDWLTKSAIPWR